MPCGSEVPTHSPQAKSSPTVVGLEWCGTLNLNLMAFKEDISSPAHHRPPPCLTGLHLFTSVQDTWPKSIFIFDGLNSSPVFHSMQKPLQQHHAFFADSFFIYPFKRYVLSPSSGLAYKTWNFRAGRVLGDALVLAFT